MRLPVVGVFADQNVKTIRMLKHGRRAKSLFKYGLEIIAAALLNPLKTIEFDVFKFLSCTKIICQLFLGRDKP